jgi:mitogen-activated protein kinase 1/3
MIGRGSYGVVCSGLNTLTNEKVAIKKIIKIFNNKEETKRLLREIRLLKFFNHENIIKIKELQNPIKLTSLEDLYIITDLMDSDLQQIIHSSQPLSAEHICFFMY